MVLRIAVQRGWEHLDPYVTTAPDFFAIFSNAYSGLLRYKTGPDTVQLVHEVIPDLAESWTQPDATTYVFTLREDAHWPNVPPVRGRRVSAADVVSSYQHLMASSVHGRAWDHVSSVRALDSRTVEITTVEPFAPLLSQIASGVNVIVPVEVLEFTDGDLRGGPVVGSGPFLFEPNASDHKRAAFFRRNPDYYGGQGSNVDTVHWTIVPHGPTRVALVESGRVDMAPIPPEEVANLTRAAGPSIATHISLNSVAWTLSLHQNPPLDAVAVREALSLAVNRQGIMDDYFNGADLFGTGMPAPDVSAQLSPAFVRSTLRYDPAAARELLAAALPDGETLSLDFMVADFGTVPVEIGERITDDLRTAGVDVTTRLVSPARYNASVLANPGVFQAAFGPTRSYFEADQWLTARFHSVGTDNGSRVDDISLDAIIGLQRGQFDTIGRGVALQDAQRLVLERHYAPPIYLDGTWHAIWDWVRGWSAFQDYPYGRYLSEVRIDGRP